MVVAAVLANEYPLELGRLNFILQIASHSRENDYFIIVNEYFKSHFDELIRGTTDRFYRELEMEPLTKEDLEGIDFCFVPDELLELDDWKGSRTAYLLHVFANSSDEAEKYIEEQIDQALKKRGQEKPEYILNCVQTTGVIRAVARHYECPLIPYVFSAIRMPHGYSQTLYMAHINDNLFNVDSARVMYEEFKPEELPFECLSRREIIALLGKVKNMPLLPLLSCDGEYEVGYAGEGRHVIPQSYQYDLVTDDDIYYDINKYYSIGQVTARLHPIQLRQACFSMAHMKNDPVQFILSAKRIATVQSQLAVKAALWNRTVCVYGNALPFSFLMKTSICDNAKVSEKDLNFILFCYFVPASLMFSKKYWLWRIQKPSSNEIYIKHLNEIVSNGGMNPSVLCDSKREREFLRARGLTEDEIEATSKIVSSNQIEYNHLLSRASFVNSDGVVQNTYSLNIKNEQGVCSKFRIYPKKGIKSIVLFLLDDEDGFVSIKSILMNGKKVAVDSEYRYVRKNEKCFEISQIDVDDSVINVEVIFDAVPFFKKYE